VNYGDIGYSNIITKEPTKWDEIRDICDAYDNEMKNIVYKNRNVWLFNSTSDNWITI